MAPRSYTTPLRSRKPGKSQNFIIENDGSPWLVIYHAYDSEIVWRRILSDQ